MKKISFLFIAVFTTVASAQWSPSGTSLTSDIFRSGSVGIGYSSAPSFGTNKFLVNGNSYFSDKILIGSDQFSFTGIEYFNILSNKGIALMNDDYLAFKMSMYNQSIYREFNIGLSHCIGCYSNVAEVGDVVLRANTPKSLLIVNEGADGDIKFVTKNSAVHWSSFTRMIISKDGNIGIGTENFTDGADTYRLSVDGSIRANRVRVYTDWADYVFEKDYCLPSLEEVENHIHEKGHLIDIPSASEVEEKGIELGEMNKLLLQKIEELTLYIITLNKEVEQLKEQIKK